MSENTSYKNKKTFRTDDIDLAAFLSANGHAPNVDRQSGEHLATFTFQRTPELLNLVEQFVTGEAVVCVKGLLSSRRRLFNAVRALQEVQS